MAGKNSKQLILCGLFAALTAVCSMISIPLPFTPIPINLATLSVALAGGLLGSKYGALSQLIYVLIGAIGLPVFHSFTGGFGIILGPTGGYIWGYILGAWIMGLVIEKTTKTRSQKKLKERKGGLFQYLSSAIAIILGYFACYLLGTIWFMVITNSTLLPALMACVIPFLAGDALKVIAATLLIEKLRKFV